MLSRFNDSYISLIILLFIFFVLLFLKFVDRRRKVCSRKYLEKKQDEVNFHFHLSGENGVFLNETSKDIESKPTEEIIREREILARNTTFNKKVGKLFFDNDSAETCCIENSEAKIAQAPVISKKPRLIPSRCKLLTLEECILSLNTYNCEKKSISRLVCLTDRSSTTTESTPHKRVRFSTKVVEVAPLNS
ncbi:unnamed protein product [Moneuplotes crassus]|uniref:Uncharacterized protein n=1 Tax=Euplotes crassus TaxID=5936 RepID=A0AAD1UR49_EUPCR|nr:unnamed protein product [Moneuplotes crassus]